MTTDLTGRFVIYGLISSEHEDDNSNLRPEHQEPKGLQAIYATDDEWEAKRLVQIEGGFIRDGVWHVAQGARDTQTGGTIGRVPD